MLWGDRFEMGTIERVLFGHMLGCLVVSRVANTQVERGGAGVGAAVSVVRDRRADLTVRTTVYETSQARYTVGAWISRLGGRGSEPRQRRRGMGCACEMSLVGTFNHIVTSTWQQSNFTLALTLSIGMGASLRVASGSSKK